MIVGFVSPLRHSLVPLAVLDAKGHTQTLSFFLDTGFNGELMLPAATVAALGLTPQGSRFLRLADNSRVEVVIYEAQLIWDGITRTVGVLASGNQPLLGMGLLLGHRFSVEMTIGGRILIEPMPA